MKILLIEDEVKLAEYLRKGLGETGYVVDVAHSGVDGLHMALQGGADAHGTRQRGGSSSRTANWCR